MNDKEIAKEITIEVVKRLDTRYGSSLKASEKNLLIARDVGKMYQEILQSVINANESDIE